MIVRSVRYLGNLLLSLEAFRTNRKIIVFTSDDWGGVRIRSNDQRKKLIQIGFDMDGNRFDRFDTLESNTDMENLFEVLLKHMDVNGSHPVLTALTNVANPNFEKIKTNNYSRYYYEPFTQTLERYPLHNCVYELYKKGIELNIFKPESHGREHLQIKWWLQYLQSGNQVVKNAFDNEFFHLSGKYLSNPYHRSLVAAFDISEISELSFQNEIIEDGAILFSELFGYKSIYFTPPAGHFNKAIETTAFDSGLKLIDVPHIRKMPVGHGKFKMKIHYLGQKSNSGLMYFPRNTMFEPNLNENTDGVDVCLKGIETAFKFRQPAIISNHRAAFVGGLSIDNRDKGIKALDRLFAEIKKKWPDAEFMSASSLYSIMNV